MESSQVETNSSFKKCLYMGQKCARELQIQKTIIEKLIFSGENPTGFKILGAIKVYERLKKDMIHYAKEANEIRNS